MAIAIGESRLRRTTNGTVFRKVRAKSSRCRTSKSRSESALKPPYFWSVPESPRSMSPRDVQAKPLSEVAHPSSRFEPALSEDVDAISRTPATNSRLVVEADLTRWNGGTIGVPVLLLGRRELFVLSSESSDSLLFF